MSFFRPYMDASPSILSCNRTFPVNVSVDGHGRNNAFPISSIGDGKKEQGKTEAGEKKKRNGPLPSSSLSLSKVNPQCIHIHSYSDVCSLVFFSERREKEPLDPSVIRTDGRESEGHRDLRFRTALCLGAPFQR